MGLSIYEKKKLEEIKKWEKEYIYKKENQLLRKVGNKIKLHSENMKQKIDIDIKLCAQITKAIETALSGCINLGQDFVAYTYDKNIAIKKLKMDHIRILEDLHKVDVKYLEKISKNVANENKIAALVEGFALGMGDLAAAIADIPIFFAITFRVMQQIAAIYGYDPEDEVEKIFILELLSYGSALGTAGKVKVQSELLGLKVAIKKYPYKKLKEMGGKYAAAVLAKQIAKDCGTTLTKKTIIKGIPIIGGVFGATFNYEFIRKMANIANMMYMKRFIEDKDDSLLYDEVAFTVIDD